VLEGTDVGAALNAVATLSALSALSAQTAKGETVAATLDCIDESSFGPGYDCADPIAALAALASNSLRSVRAGNPPFKPNSTLDDCGQEFSENAPCHLLFYQEEDPPPGATESMRSRWVVRIGQGDPLRVSMIYAYPPPPDIMPEITLE
jgi:hypothetical protein